MEPVAVELDRLVMVCDPSEAVEDIPDVELPVSVAVD